MAETEVLFIVLGFDFPIFFGPFIFFNKIVWNSLCNFHIYCYFQFQIGRSIACVLEVLF